MVANLLAYDEVADFLAALAPEKLINLKPSQTVQDRVTDLIYRKKDTGISSDEQFELDRYLALEYLISLTKARARARLKAAA